MADKKPIRAVFNDSGVATGLAEFQSGDTLGLTHGGLGASLSIGSAGQVLKVNSGASALEFGNVEAVVNIDNATDLTSATLATTDLLLASDGGTEGRVTLAQLDTLFSGTSKTLTNKTLTTPTITTPIINAGAQLKNGSTSAGFLEFFEDSDNGSNKVTLIGPSSTADITLTLPAAAGTIVASGDTGTVTNAMLAGSIAASKLAGSIGNSKLSNSSITVSDGSNTSDISLGSTVTFAATANETTVSESSGTVTIGIVDSPTIGGNLTVTGNLTVNGTTTTLSTTNSVISDKLIELSTGTSGTPSGDIGIVGERGSSDNIFIGFDESLDEFLVGTGSFTGASTGDLTITRGDFSAKSVMLYDPSDSSHSVKLQAPSISSNIVLTLPNSDGDANQLLATDGSGNLSFISATAASGAGLSNVSDDSSPSLGGDLDVNGNDIVSTSNGNINLLPNGSGTVIIDGNGSTGGIIISDGNIDMRSGSGAVSKIKFYCEVNNAHAQTLQAQPHSAGSSAVLTLPVATGTLIGSGDTGSVTNTMLAGSIAASKLAGSIGNSKLSNSSISVSDGSSSTATALGGTITFSGTSNEVTVSESSGTVTIGLPDNVTVGGNLTITGNLNVNGSTTTVDSTTVSIQNAFVFEGATDDAHETTLTTIDPTADRTISLPNVSGTIITTGNFTDITNLGVLSGGIPFEGSTADGNETTLAVTDPTADRTITLPDETFKVSSLANKATLDGDGSTTTITVGSGYNVNQFLVTINGIVQEPTEDYTYSSTTLTLGTAPVSGERVVVRY